MYTRNNVDLTQDISKDLSEALSWSLLKKSVSGEDLTTLETSTTSACSSAGSDELKLFSNVKTFTSNNKHFNTSLVTPINK
jgi:hypothetical protein